MAKKPGWVIIDAHEMDPQRIKEYCAAHPTKVALFAEYIDFLPYQSHLRDYLLGVVNPRTGILGGLCWLGGNVVPVNLAPASIPLIAREIRRRRLRYSSIVGPTSDVAGLWEEAADVFPIPQEIRAHQPHLEIDHAPAVVGDQDVQPTREGDYDLVFEASVAMFTEEVGYSPLSSGGGYARRVKGLVTDGRSLSKIVTTPSGREVIFKADLGTVGFGVVQIQGVWVNPDYRGQGIAVPAMAEVVNYAQRNFAPRVSLYVNHYNAPALATYASVGFTQTQTFTTVLF